MTIKQIICLANSKKLSGRCIAGRELLAGTPGQWIRPVSARPSEEVSEWERRYNNGVNPQVLDVINIPLIKATPHSCQTENWLLNSREPWVKVGQATWQNLQALEERPQVLFVNVDSTYHGENDQIPSAIADTLPCSLHLIRASNLSIRVFTPEDRYGNKRKVQARFQYNGFRYALLVTDPAIEAIYLAQDDGDYPLGENLLCVSLTMPFTKSSGEICRYKVVAAIFQNH
jgi:hypothetical protein